MTRREAIATGLGALLGTYITPATRPGIDLTRFCSRTPGVRYDLTAPYHLDDYTYATDTAVCVRVAPAGGDKAGASGPVPPFGGLSWNHDRLRCWQPMPDVPPLLAADADCPTCDGFGCMGGPGTECDRCWGIGWYGQIGTGACDRCGTRGWIPNGPVCPACGGKAIGVHPSVVRTPWGYYEAALYRKVMALPGVEVVPDYWRCMKSQPLLKFRFDGGDGLLMGLDQIRAEERIRNA